MKKNIKIRKTIIAPAIALVMASSIPSLTVSADTLVLPDNVVQTDNANEVPFEDSATEENIENKDVFDILKGKIIGKNEVANSIRIENDEIGVYDILINDETIFVDKSDFISLDDFNEGEEITVHYVKRDFMTAIYPPQISSNVIVKDDSESIGNVYVGRFNENLLSFNGDLKLNVSEETPIVDQNNNPYEGSLENKALVVFYTIATFSIPPQAPPTKIIVLDYELLPTIQGGLVTPGETEIALPMDMLDSSIIPQMQFFVDGKHIEAPSAYVNENGVTMLPLRALISATDNEIRWDEEAQQIIIGTATTMTVGKDSYFIGRRMPMELGAAPELKNDSTFVPLDFFMYMMHWRTDVSQGKFDFNTKDEIIFNSVGEGNQVGDENVILFVE